MAAIGHFDFCFVIASPRSFQCGGKITSKENVVQVKYATTTDIKEVIFETHFHSYLHFYFIQSCKLAQSTQSNRLDPWVAMISIIMTLGIKIDTFFSTDIQHDNLTQSFRDLECIKYKQV